MCLAEALLRIPDAATWINLLKIRLGSVDWEQHAGESDSWFCKRGDMVFDVDR